MNRYQIKTLWRQAKDTANCRDIEKGMLEENRKYIEEDVIWASLIMCGQVSTDRVDLVKAFKRSKLFSVVEDKSLGRWIIRVK